MYPWPGHYEEIDTLQTFFNDHINKDDYVDLLNKVSPDSNIKIDSGLPWLRLNFPLDIDWDKVLQEAKSLDDQFIPHRSGGGHQGWSSLVIHGLGKDKTQAFEYYGHKEEPFDKYHWTEICEQAPYTKRVFSELFPYRSYCRIRFMKLEPGGFILPHHDDDWRHLGPVNIALNHPKGCEMVMEDYGIIPFQSGELFNLDISRYHSVWNRSDESRYHIIIHGTPGPEWDGILKKSVIAEKSSPPIKQVPMIECRWWPFLKGDSSLRSLSILPTGEMLTRGFTDLDDHDLEQSLASWVQLGPHGYDKVTIGPKEQMGLELQLNDLVLSSGDGLVAHHSRNITYDVDIEDDTWNESLEMNKNEFYFFNPKDWTEFQNTTNEERTLLVLRNPMRIHRNLDPSRIINKSSSTSVTQWTLKQLTHKNFHIPDSFYDVWRSEGLKKEDAQELFFLCVIPDNFSEEQISEFSNRMTLASSLPFEPGTVLQSRLGGRLNELKDQYEFVVLLGAGLYIRDCYEFIPEVKKQFFKMQKENCFLSGHIMDWGGGRCPYLHEQTILLRTNSSLDYKDLTISKESSMKIGYTASEQKFHDHYTPFALTPSGEEAELSRPNFFSPFIKLELENGRKVLNLPASLRHAKRFSYPNGDDFSSLIKIKQEIAKKVNICRELVYIVNNNVKHCLHLLNLPKKQFVSPGSGLLPVIYAIKNNPESLIIYDISPIAIEFWRGFFRTKNTDDIHDLLNLYEDYFTLSKHDFLTELNKVIHDYCDNSEEIFFNKLQKLSIQFFIVDLLEVPDRLVDAIEKESLIFVSNIYEYHNAMFLMEEESIRAQFIRFCNRLAQKHNAKHAVDSLAYQATIVGEGADILIFDEREPKLLKQSTEIPFTSKNNFGEKHL